MYLGTTDGPFEATLINVGDLFAKFYVSDMIRRRGQGSCGGTRGRF